MHPAARKVDSRGSEGVNDRFFHPDTTPRGCLGDVKYQVTLTGGLTLQDTFFIHSLTETFL